MRPKISLVPAPGQQQGFTLIEVLVAGLILSVGVLGVAGLQITTLKNLQSSQTYGVAAMLANDMIDRMWGEPGGGSRQHLRSRRGAGEPGRLRSKYLLRRRYGQLRHERLAAKNFRI